jgi:hypothetical protein
MDPKRSPRNFANNEAACKLSQNDLTDLTEESNAGALSEIDPETGKSRSQLAILSPFQWSGTLKQDPKSLSFG